MDATVDAGVLASLRALMDADAREGRIRSLARYLQFFPGHGDLVAAEYRRLQAEGEIPDPAEDTPAPAPGSAGGAEGGPGEAPRRIGPYVIEAEIGRGGMGVVYRAHDTRLERSVALKVLPPSFATSPEMRARFEREALVASRLDHPGICTVYEAGADGASRYIAMRLVEGRTLSDLLAARSFAADDEVRSTTPGATGHGETSELCLVVEQAARALHVAHEAGLIHRDVKPANLIITGDGSPVLLDFGLARDEETGSGATLTRTGTAMGTPAYMSPEQIESSRGSPDRRTDVYGLGVTLYEMLTLHLPFEAPTVDALYRQILVSEPVDPRTHNASIRDDLAVVVLKCLEKDRDRRYATALDLAEELRRVRERRPILARPVGPLARLWRWAERRPAVAATGSALLLSLVGGLGVSLHLLRSETRERKDKESALQAQAKALHRARALALLGASERAQEVDNMRAVLLARAAVEEEVRLETTARLRDALVEPLEVFTTKAHAEGVTYVGCSPDGTLFTTCSMDGTAKLWDVSGRCVATLRGHERAVFSTRFTADGRRLLTTSADQTVRLWDLEGHQLVVYRGNVTPVERAVFSPSGEEVFTCARDGSIRRFAVDGTPIGDFQAHEGWSQSVSISADGTRLLTSGMDGATRLWTLDGTLCTEFKAADGQVIMSSFSPDESRIVTTTATGSAYLWDLAGHPVATLTGHTGALRAARFSPDGALVLTASRDGTARLWRLDGSVAAVLRGHRGDVLDAQFACGGTRVITVSGDGSARVWDLMGGLIASMRGHDNAVMGAAFLPGEDRVLTASRDGGLRIWDLSETISASPRKGSGDRPAGVQVLQIAGDGDWTARGFQSGRVMLRSAAGEVRTIEGDGSAVTRIAWSPRGDRLAVGNLAGVTRMFDVRGRLLLTLAGHGRPILSIEFRPDGEGLLTGDAGGHVGLFDASGHETVQAEHDGERVFIARFLPDRKSVLTVARHAVIVHGPDGGTRARLERSRTWFWTAAVSADGLRVATADRPGNITLWNLDGTVVRDFPGSGHAAMALAFSPDSKHVAAACLDGVGRVWPVAGGPPVLLRGHEQVIQSVRFSPDGTMLLTTSDDGTLRLWDREGRCMATIPIEGPALERSFFSSTSRAVLIPRFDGSLRQVLVHADDLLRRAAEVITRDFTEKERNLYAEILAPVDAR